MRKKKILSFRDKKKSLICILHMVVSNMTFICEGWAIHLIFMSLTNSIEKQRGKAQLYSIYCSTDRWMGFIFSVSNLFFCFFFKGRWIILILNGNHEQYWPKWNIELCKRKKWFCYRMSFYVSCMSQLNHYLETSSLTCETRSAQPLIDSQQPVHVCDRHLHTKVVFVTF